MNKYDYLEEMSESEALLFKKSIRKMLDSTFLVKGRDKDNKLYQFVARGSNRQNITEYLCLIGYTLIVSDEQGVAMLAYGDTDDENVGLKRSNLQLFDTMQVKILLVLWQTYLSKCSYEEEVHITFGEIIDRLKHYGITVELNQTTFKESIILFRRFSLIECQGKDFKADATVRLYASLQFCMDIHQLNQVIKDYISNNQFEMETEEEWEEDV